MSAVSPLEGEQQAGREGRSIEERFTKVFGQTVEDTLEALKETSEEANAAKARKTEAIPSTKEVEEHNSDHSVFRSWCPHCVKGKQKHMGTGATRAT